MNVDVRLRLLKVGGLFLFLDSIIITTTDDGLVF
jgi:hypothetical protein